MVILHNTQDKVSRDFVAAYGEGHTIVTDDECAIQYPYHSAKPSVVIDVPETLMTGKGADGVEFTYTYPAHKEMCDCRDGQWSVVEAYLAEVAARPRP